MNVNRFANRNYCTACQRMKPTAPGSPWDLELCVSHVAVLSVSRIGIPCRIQRHYSKGEQVENLDDDSVWDLL